MLPSFLLAEQTQVPTTSCSEAGRSLGLLGGALPRLYMLKHKPISISLSIYICIWNLIYIYIYACEYACEHACESACVLVGACVYVCAEIYMSIHAHIGMYACLCSSAVYTHVCMHSAFESSGSRRQTCPGLLDQDLLMGVSKKWEVLFWGPYVREPVILVPYYVPLILGKLANMTCTDPPRACFLGHL